MITTGRLIHERDELAIERFATGCGYEAEVDEQRNRMTVLTQTGHVGDRAR